MILCCARSLPTSLAPLPRLLCTALPLSAMSTGFSFGAAAGAAPTFGAAAPTFGAAAAPTFGAAAAAPTFGAAAAAPTFGAPAAAAAPTFGAFGTTSNAAGGFGFGTAAPAAGGFGFGAPAAAASSAAPTFGAFGSTPAAGTTAAAPSFGGFGSFAPVAAPATTTPFGVPVPAVQFPPHSIEARLLAIKAAYSASSPECRFQTVFYNKVDANTVQQYVKPPQANVRLWESAVKNNPDPSALVPSLAVGFEDLRKRVLEQEKASAAFGATLEAMGESLAGMIHGHEASTAASLAQLQRVHAQQSHRLLQLVDRVECARSRDVTPRLPEELEFEHKLLVLSRALSQPSPLHSKIAQLGQAVKQLEARGGAGAGAEDAVTSSGASAAAWLLQDESANEKLFHFLQTQRSALEHVTAILKQDQRDLQTIAQVTQQANAAM